MSINETTNLSWPSPPRNPQRGDLVATYDGYYGIVLRCESYWDPYSGPLYTVALANGLTMDLYSHQFRVLPLWTDRSNGSVASFAEWLKPRESTPPRKDPP